MKQSISKYDIKSHGPVVMYLNSLIEWVLSLRLNERYQYKWVLSFDNVCANCRLQHWGNTTLSGGLRRIFWRSRGKEHELTTRKRTSWGGHCPSWMRKVKEDCSLHPKAGYCKAGQTSKSYLDFESNQPEKSHPLPSGFPPKPLL